MRRVALLAMTACGRVGFDAVPGAGDAGDASSGRCTPGIAVSMFGSQPDPCQPWGTSSMSAATVTAAGGQLSITPELGQTGFGGCLNQQGVAFAPIFLEVRHALDTTIEPGSYTLLQMFAAGGPTTSVGIVMENGELHLYDLQANVVVASAPYDASAMRWWRIRADDRGAAVLGEVSPDGVSWAAFGSVAQPPPSQCNINVGAGNNAGGGQADTAILANVDACR